MPNATAALLLLDAAIAPSTQTHSTIRAAARARRAEGALPRSLDDDARTTNAGCARIGWAERSTPAGRCSWIVSGVSMSYSGAGGMVSVSLVDAGSRLRARGPDDAEGAEVVTVEGEQPRVDRGRELGHLCKVRV